MISTNDVENRGDIRQLSVRLTPELHALLKQRALEEGENESVVIRRALRSELATQRLPQIETR